MQQRRFEPAHLSLALSRRLMRNLCAVVLVSVRAMGDALTPPMTRSPSTKRRGPRESNGRSVVGRGELVAVERLAASGRLPVECVAVPVRQTAAYVAVGDQLVASLAQQAATPRGRAHPTGAAATRTAPPLRLVRRTTA